MPPTLGDTYHSSPLSAAASAGSASAHKHRIGFIRIRVIGIGSCTMRFDLCLECATGGKITTITARSSEGTAESAVVDDLQAGL
jgi:hypothetical protein